MNVFKFICFFVIMCFAGCGVDSNFNKIFLLDDSAERLDAQIDKSRALYNAGEYDEALRVMDSLIKDYPNSEEAITIYSYVKLGAIGLSFFDILKVLVYTAADAESESDPKVKSCASLDTLIGNSQKSGKLDCLLGLSLGEDVFKGQTIDQIRETNTVLASLNQIIGKSCRFFEEGSEEESRPRNFNDIRHNCGRKVSEGKTGGRLALSWILVHIFEAVYFNIQATYIQTQALMIGKGGKSIASAMKRIGTVINATSSTASLVTEALNNIETVTKSITLFLPEGDNTDQAIKSLDSVTESLKKATDMAFGSQENVGDSGKILQNLDSSIVERKDEVNGLTGGEKQEFCDGYTSAGGDTSNFPQGITLECN